VRSGGFEREMLLGELVLSAGDRGAAAASSPVMVEGELPSLICTQLCQEFPPASAGIA